MTGRRRARNTRPSGLASRASAISGQARTILDEQTRGDFPVFGQTIAPARIHNPLAGLDDGTLNLIQYAGLAIILGIGFGYLAPNITWPMKVTHGAATAGILAACAVSFLAIDRLTDNARRMCAAARYWKVGDTGVSVTGYDTRQNSVTVGFVSWADVMVAEAQDGFVMLINSVGEVLAEIENPTQAREILATVQMHRAHRGDAAPRFVAPAEGADGLDRDAAQVRVHRTGSRIDPRFDLPETFDDGIARRPLHVAGHAVDLDLVGGRRRIEPRLPTPPMVMRTRPQSEIGSELLAIGAPHVAIRSEITLGGAEAVIDADYIEVSAEAAAAPRPPQPYEEDDVLAHLNAAIPPATAPSQTEEPDWAACVLPDDTRMTTFARGYEPEPKATRIDHAVEETFRALFEAIPARVVPDAVAKSRAATTQPVALDETRVLASNDDPTASRDDAVISRLLDQLVATARERGVDPRDFIEAGLRLVAVKQTTANADARPPASKVA